MHLYLIAAVLSAVGLGAVVIWALKTAPTCTCGRTECGGGCWTK